MRNPLIVLAFLATLFVVPFTATSLMSFPAASAEEVVTDPVPVPVEIPPAEDQVDPPITGGDGQVIQPPSGGTTDVWVGIVTTILTLILGWVGTMLRKKWQIDSQRQALDATKSLWEQRNFLIDNRIIPFAWSTAEHWMLTQLPAIIKDATDGDGFKWKTHWSALRSYTKARVIKKFAAENVDVLTLLGERELDDLLDRALMKLIAKLPESVQAFLPESVVDKITDWATAFAVDKGKDLLRLEDISKE